MPLREKIIACRPDHLFGYWAIEPSVFEQIFEQAIQVDIVMLRAESESKAKDNDEPKLAYTVEDGLAEVSMAGPMTKYPSSYSSMFGGSSSLEKQKAVRDAVKDPHVKGIALVIDSPGGTVSGTPELADEVKAASKVKPIYSVVDDSATSAAYWVGSQASGLYASRISSIGSIGTTIRMYDTSGQAKQEGVRAIDVGSGKFKNIGMRGKPVTPEEESEIKRVVDSLNEQFISAISSSRKLSPQSIKDLEARVYIGNDAKDLKLVDHIASREEAIDDIRSRIKSIGKTSVYINKGLSKDVLKEKSAAVGHASDKQQPAEITRSSTMALTKDQEASIRAKVPGAANVTAESLESFVADYAISAGEQNQKLGGQLAQANQEISGLKSQAIPKPDKRVAEGHLGLYDKQVTMLVREERLLPAQADLLKGAVKAQDGTYKIECVDQSGIVSLPASVVFSALELNKPKGLTNEQTPAQEHERKVPEGGTPKQQTGEDGLPPKDASLAERVKARTAKSQAKSGNKVAT